MQAPSPEQLEEIKAGIQALFSENQLIELRIRTTSGYWRGLYFSDHVRMAEAVAMLDQDSSRVQSLYYVFNKINPKTIEVRRDKCDCDKCVRGGRPVINPDAQQVEKAIEGPTQHLTGDEDIETLCWLFIDVDTIRPEEFKHEPASEDERKASQEVAKKVIAHLADKGWPQPLLAFSGNGFHILPRLNLPNTAENVALILDCLNALAAKFDCPAAKIDNSVRNAARLTRAYGSTTRKGSNTAERPYRRNKAIIKGYIGSVSTDQLLALSNEAPRASKTPQGAMPLLHPSFSPDDFIDWYEQQGAFEVTGPGEWQGHEVKVIDHCIISGTKHTGSVRTGFIIGDTLGYHCWSPECNDPNIGDVLRKLGELGFKRYPKKIWVEEPLLLNFEKRQEEFVRELEEEAEEYQPPQKGLEKDEAEPEPESFIDLVQKKAAEAERAEAAQDAEDAGRTPPPRQQPQPQSEKPIRIKDANPGKYAEWLMGIIFRDPKKADKDFTFYRQRLWKRAPHLADYGLREGLGALLSFEMSNKYLPSKEELIDYITHSDEAREFAHKDEAIAFIHAVKDDGTHFLDTTARRFISEMDWVVEKEVVRKAFKKYLKEGEAEEIDIEAFRSELRKHWAASLSFNSDFKPGTWQENADSIFESFRRDYTGEGDSRKFRLGFDTIDNSGMNIGLDGNHAIVLYGPAANRKTNAAMTIALNFAMQGKRGLFLAGEHLREKVEKRLTLMLSYYLRKTDDNPDGIVPVIPGLPAWEGINRTVTEEDLTNVGIVLNELKLLQVVPGYLEVQNIASLTRGNDDPLQAIMDYIDSTHKKYDWDFVIIDPLDSVLPIETGENKSQFQASAAVVDRLFDYSRSFAGDRGLMIIVTAQFRAETRREIEKIQAKNGGADDYDDEIIAVLRRDSNIQYIGNKLTQRFDLALGVGLRTKDGEEGMLVLGRSREAGLFDVMQFHIDKESNLMLDAKSSVVAMAAPAAPQTLSDDHRVYDAL